MDLDGACRAVVTVPAWNEEAFIAPCLQGLFAQRALDGRPLDERSFAVVVVDSHCTDATVEVVRRVSSSASRRGVTIVRAQGPGVALARKAGMDLAARALVALGHGRRIVASIDADTVAHPEWLARMLSLFDAEHTVSFVGGGFVYADDVTARLARLRHYGATWRAVSELLDPIRYVETVGSNFGIDAAAYESIGGVPLFTVGEDLAVAEIALARGLRGAWLPVENRTSARRAVGDFADFLTGDYRFRAWGTHGRQSFQPHRGTVAGSTPLAEIDPALERQLTVRCLRYFARQHVIKPLVLVPSFRRPALQALGLDPSAFESAAEAAERAHPAGEPFHLEDRVLAVDAAFLDPIHRALVNAQARMDAGGHDPAQHSAGWEIPFHVRALGA
jgi:hypothetical protein